MLLTCNPLVLAFAGMSGWDAKSILPATVLGFHPRTSAFGHRGPAAAVGFAGEGVLLALLVGELALQLLEASPPGFVEGAVRQRRAHRAAGLVAVTAVAEAAGADQRFDVREGGGEA